MNKSKQSFKFGVLPAVVTILLVAAALFALPAGCGRNAKPAPAPVQDQPPAAQPAPVEDPVKITLYFSDKQAQKLVPEEREVLKKGDPLEEVIVRELIKGPAADGRFRTIPENARLISVKVSEGIAAVNFSKEIQTSHWGGSAGETMTVYSVVNSLTQIDKIKKVQFLVEGKKIESLLGHMDLSIPVSPDKSLTAR